MDEDVEWPPPATRVRAALWRAEAHVEHGEYAQAARALEEVLAVAPAADRELVRGVYHLAAAGYRADDGDRARAARQLAHARRRLAPFLPGRHEVDLAALIAVVEARARA